MDHIGQLLQDLRTQTIAALKPKEELDILLSMVATSMALPESAKWRDIVTMPDIDNNDMPDAASSLPPDIQMPSEESHAAELFVCVDKFKAYIDVVRDVLHVRTCVLGIMYHYCMHTISNLLSSDCILLYTMRIALRSGAF